MAVLLLQSYVLVDHGRISPCYVAWYNFLPKNMEMNTSLNSKPDFLRCSETEQNASQIHGRSTTLPKIKRPLERSLENRQFFQPISQHKSYREPVLLLPPLYFSTLSPSPFFLNVLSYPLSNFPAISSFPQISLSQNLQTTPLSSPLYISTSLLEYHPILSPFHPLISSVLLSLLSLTPLSYFYLSLLFSLSLFL